jgi:hypothetical protein
MKGEERRTDDGVEDPKIDIKTSLLVLLYFVSLFVFYLCRKDLLFAYKRVKASLITSLDAVDVISEMRTLFGKKEGNDEKEKRIETRDIE